MPLALLATLAPQTPTFRLEATTKGMALIHGARRLADEPPFEGEALPVARWRGGATLGTEGDDLVYRTKGEARPVGLKAALDAWLMNDALWGGHGAANALRYQHLNGYELGLTVRDLLPQADGTALGVATVRLLQQPSRLAYPQVLFRFRPGSEALEPLRTLSTAGVPDVGLPPHRLFRLGGRLLLQDRDLSELLPSGASGRVVKTLPASTVSLGASGGRWLLLRTKGEPGPGAEHLAYDARTGRLTEVFPHADFCRVDPLRPYALFWAYAQEGMRAWAVRLSDGRRAPIDGRPQLAWDGLAIDLYSNPIVVWSADTGKLVARLPRPKGR